MQRITLKVWTTFSAVFLVAALALAGGCGEDPAASEGPDAGANDGANTLSPFTGDEQPDPDTPKNSSASDAPTDTPADGSPDASTAEQPGLTPEKLHAMIKSANPKYADKGRFQFDREGQIVGVDLQDASISDISPLKGLPLRALFLESTNVKDLSPLDGMRLVQVALSNTPVKDLSPLRGMPIRELRLVRTEVNDVGALEGMPVEMLWLNDSPVESIKVLQRAPLVSLTLKGTKVKDLSPVRTMPKLQRLHIAKTPVTDLTPLAELPLTRLVFTPANIKDGIREVRAIGTMQQIGTEFGDPDSDLTDPVTFWKKYDDGAFK